ncbi:protein WVD2-like 5 isoform X2 [Tasmannia lanceolata]
MDKVNGTLDSCIETVQRDVTSESITQLEESETAQSSIGEVEGGSFLRMDNKSSTISMASVTKDPVRANHSRSQKGQVKIKNSSSGTEMPSSPKHVVTTWVKKTKDGKQADATSHVSNGSLTSTSRSKQPFSLSINRVSFNGRQSVDRNDSVDSGRPTRSTSAPSSTQNSKSGKSGSASSTSNASQSEGLKEQIKTLKPLKQGTLDKVEHSLSASSSPTAAGSKPRRIGTTPSYSFSFKCDERAEKRREYFSKLEEKIHAKEVEKTSMQAKSKETQEAEIKLLRKSLTFKATPMPSFYQEPAPPKMELKKIPPTRAKSPKLGRHKGSPSTDGEGNDNHTHGSARLSLDERTSRNGPTKESSPHFKKQHRKSLPKLPSEKSALSNPDEETPAKLPEQHKLESQSAPKAEPSPAEFELDEPSAFEEQPNHVEKEPVIEEAVSCEPSTEQH